MIKITNCRTYGIEESIFASGYPMRTEAPTENQFDAAIHEMRHIYTMESSEHFKRACKLGKAKSGTGHDNFLKGIIVQFDLEYPMYFTPQLQRYHWIDPVSSMSKMHKLVEMDLSDYSTEIQILVNEYKLITDPVEREMIFNQLINMVPARLPLTMRISTNYLQLKTIYYQRKNHRLKHDWGVFTDWILALPYFKELVGLA